MANINDLYPSKFLKESDLKGREFHLTIASIVVETLGSGQNAKQKPVIYFNGAQKGFVLNRSNADEIANAYGLDTDHWIGKQLTLYPSTTIFAGQRTPCIKVRPYFQSAPLPQTPPAPLPQTPPPPVSAGFGRPSIPATRPDDDLDSDVPF